MSTYVLVSGSLFHAPEQRTSKAGKPFVTATIKSKDGEAVQWWKIVAFAECAQAELLRLGDGDAVACQGALKIETYEKDGETKIALSIIANNVLALRKPRESDKISPSEQPARADRPFDDAIPY
jgi:single-stranded DNA-binding protein